MSKRDERWAAPLIQEALRDSRGRVNVQLGFIGDNELDLAIIVPAPGCLIVLELKEWVAREVDNTPKGDTWWEVIGHGRKRHPIKQAEDAFKALVDRIRTRDRGVAEMFGKTLTFLTGAAFSNISKDEAKTIGLFSNSTLPPGHVYLWKDDFEPMATKMALMRSIDAAYAHRRWSKRRLDLKLVDRVWKAVNPDNAMSPEPRPPNTPPAGESDAFEDPKPQISGGYHRVNGVVGSGKTQFVATKVIARLLSRAPKRSQGDFFQGNLPKSLVLTFTASGASQAREVLRQWCRQLPPAQRDQVDDAVSIRNFHEFISKEYGASERGEDGVDELLRSGRVSPEYDMVIFDEFQDAQPGWGRLIARLVKDPSEGLLVVTFDPAQGATFADLGARFGEIVDEMSKRGVVPKDPANPWASRTHYLRKSYRVPAAIGRFAMKVHTALTHNTFESLQGTSEEALAKVISKAIKPEFCSERSRVEVIRIEAATSQDELAELAIVLEDCRKRMGLALKDVGVVVAPSPERGENLAEITAAALAEMGVPSFPIEGTNRNMIFSRQDAVLVLRDPLIS